RVKQIYGNDSQQTIYATSALKALFQGLIEKADKDNDTRVTTEEFVDLMKTCDPKDNHTWYNDYCISMFKLFDVSSDQKLDIAEYADGMQTYGADERTSNEAFRKFAK
uniref:EF-hand domain-containing protein n=1 Tax=Romanomermis culicivorax TaxID=13658 RepID=A0A915JMR1_ROMCU